MMLVSLIGAGPGDPGLLTLNGKNALASADVIIFDALANEKLLSFCNKQSEKIYVGKIAEQHALPQEEINKLLVKKARENNGQRVARLKGGDPFIFGRGGEEAEYLRDHDIPFEVIPGISSAIAVPTYAGISLTHRGYASSLTILTGHENPEKKQSSHNWESLVKSKATLVFVMGMKNLGFIVKSLLDAGMQADVPSAVIYRGTTPFQKSVFTPLIDLEKAVREAGITHPALIVIGKVVALGPKLAWFEKRPLLGRTIVVTRATEQASDLCNELENLGANVIQCPAIKIIPPKDYSAIDEALNQLDKYDWLIFTSINGVKFFWKRLFHAGKDTRSLSGCKVAAIGPATAKGLEQHGIMPDVVPKKFIAEEVVQSILDFEGNNIAGKRILVPRAAKARMILVEELAGAGAIIDVAPVYQTIADDACSQLVASLIREDRIDCITFASSSTVKNFLDLISSGLLREHPSVKLAAIGPITANALKENGLTADIMPSSFTIPDLVKAITGYFEK